MYPHCSGVLNVTQACGPPTKVNITSVNVETWKLMLITFEFITGLSLGIEHLSGEEDDEFHWIIGIHLGIIRLLLVSPRYEE